MAPILELNDVSFAYGKRNILDGVSCAVRPGLVTGLLGPNGTGKSTMLRLAAGLLRPSNGAVRLCGRDISELDRVSIARRIAMVFQEGPLPDAFTCLEIALTGRMPHLGWLRSESAEDRQIALMALELVGAAGLAHRRVGDLSGGERQRLRLARALAQEPDVLLLDEPTTHLDPANQLVFLDLIRRLARMEGVAVLSVFHDVNLAAEYCDRLAFLTGGRIAAFGEPASIVESDLIARVYGVCLPVIRHRGRPIVLYASAPDPDGNAFSGDAGTTPRSQPVQELPTRNGG
jgi:iron complex transport system ATP-binding protein